MFRYRPFAYFHCPSALARTLPYCACGRGRHSAHAFLCPRYPPSDLTQCLAYFIYGACCATLRAFAPLLCACTSYRGTITRHLPDCLTYYCVCVFILLSRRLALILIQVHPPVPSRHVYPSPVGCQPYGRASGFDITTSVRVLLAYDLLLPRVVRVRRFWYMPGPAFFIRRRFLRCHFPFAAHLPRATVYAARLLL